MKFTQKTVVASKEILANDHYVAIEYDCSALSSLATDGIISAGTLIPSNDGNAMGVLLYDVDLNTNPNGAVVIHGNKTQIQKYSVAYDLNGATGTAVTDSSSPYSYGATVTVKAAPTISAYPSGKTAFDKWNTKADGSGTSYAASATFAITDNVTLYAIYKA